MLVIAGLLLVLIIVDGLRRMISKGRSEVKLSKHAKQGYSDGVAMDAQDAADAARLRFELPGETRVKKRDGDHESDFEDDAIPDNVPVLNQPVEQQLDFDDLIKMSAPVEEEPAQALEDSNQEPVATVEPVESSNENIVPDLKDEVVDDYSGEAIEDVIAIHVRSNNTDGFDGPLVLSTILEIGMRFGSMEIFHKRGGSDSGSRIVYSLANAVEPGTFNLNDVSSFSTPCVVFFMQLPCPSKPLAAFRDMLDAADKFAKALDGILLDEQRNVLHQQTLVHIHERIQEYERKQLLAQKRDK